MVKSSYFIFLLHLVAGEMPVQLYKEEREDNASKASRYFKSLKTRGASFIN